MRTLSKPFIFSIELTAACNNDCPACGNVFTERSASLSISQWKQIVENIGPHAQVIKITGGEPTLHPDFFDIVNLIAEKNIKFALFTNGRWQNPGKLIDFLKAIPPCTGLLISLQGPDAFSHEKFTNILGSYEETCQNIRLASAAGLTIHTSTVLTPYNSSHLGEVVDVARILGASRAVFNRYLGHQESDFQLDPWQLRTAIGEIESLMEMFNTDPLSPITVRYGSCIPQCFMPSSSTGCWAGVAYCTIDPRGNLRPCNHSPTIAGNLLKEPLENLWHNQTMNNWRALTPGQCSSCMAFEVCHGGCRALGELFGKVGDPLIGIALNQDPEPVEMDLHEKSCPVLACIIQPETFGYALIHGHNIIQVTHDAKIILDELKGQKSLKQIHSDFGQEALNLVGSLYLQDMVIFV